MKTILFLFFTLLTFTLTAQNCENRYQTEIFSAVDVTTVEYGSNTNMAGNIQSLEMDIYQAQGDSATDRPVVIFCFGGSFFAGDRTSPELVSFATSLAKRGYVCASIDYRLATSVLDLVDEEKMVKVVFGAVQDGKAAIRYFRKNADEGNSLGIDPNQIFIGGTSAGGILGINLAYVDTLSKLKNSWQTWANQIGGLEGESGNPGYCSSVSGVFSFAGAVGDTSYINPNDVPFYSCHAVDDQTVLYDFGPPLNGIAPISLYGSGDIEIRLNNLGIYNSVDTYPGGDHPPLNGNNLDTTTVHLSTFLYNLLDCNPSNLKHPNQQDCSDFSTEPVGPLNCENRYQTEIFSDVDVTTVEYGSNINMAGNLQSLKMDIYQAQGDTMVNRPVVIFCFGGSFYAGNRTSPELVSFATSLAKRGYVCASIDYRLASSAFDLIDERKMVKVVFGAVQDGKAAIRYFRKNADEGNSLGIDPDQIFIGGTSAGGILAINLAYVDSLKKLKPIWKDWANQIGGLEGESGNPGYCSYVSGVFSFSGAVGDTSYINPNDVPFYSCHAVDDQTVLYDFGPPLNGLAPVDLYGSGDLEIRLNNLGIYNTVDTYPGGDHPPLNGNNLDTTTEHLSTFLYNLLDCNPSNLKPANQQNCNDFYVEPIDSSVLSISNMNNILEFKIYPNPSSQFVTIESEKRISKIVLIDVLGRTLKTNTFNLEKAIKLDINDLPKGIYNLKVLVNDSWQSTSLIKK